MRHVSEGALRALHDDALNAEERAQVQEHLATCSECAKKDSILRERADRVGSLLSKLEPQPRSMLITVALARSRFEAYRQKRKEQQMARNPFSPRYRPAWAVAALVLLTVITLTVPPVRTLAGNLLGIFRVERIAFTPVDIEALPDESTLDVLAPEIERMFGDALAVVTEKEPEEVTEATARERATFPIRLPDAPQAARFEWTPPVHVAVEIDLARIQALFTELGYEDIELPRELDGTTLEADFSGMLTTYHGTCGEESSGQECITLVQMASPTVSAPEGLDAEQLGRIYLELLGTPRDEAMQLSKQIDWTTTLVLPFPHHVNLTHETLPLDGTQATLLHSASGYRPAPEYLLTWVKNDIIYAIAGKGDYVRAQELVNSLR